jgi:hypothetical protein
MMVAEYLESVGIKTRIFMTRFVVPSYRDFVLRKTSETGVDLPMGNTSLGINKNPCLLVQPILVKEFMQEVDKSSAFAISSENYARVYESCAGYTYIHDTEFKKSNFDASSTPYGQPQWSQEAYWEGVERYRNKYQEYVKLGIFKSKEVLPQAMLFFHCPAINSYLNGFLRQVRNSYDIYTDAEVVLEVEVNQFFNWWMRTSANTIKHKINIINSSAYEKDIREIEKDLQETYGELKNIVDSSVHKSKSKPVTPDSEIYKRYGDFVLNKLNITYNGRVDVVNYVNYIVKELTTFADGGFYPTPEEEVEKRLEFKKTIYQELKKFQ